MKVILKSPFFVEGRRYRVGSTPSSPVEMPDHLRNSLPSSAIVVEEPKADEDEQVDIDLLKKQSEEAEATLQKALEQDIDPTEAFKGAITVLDPDEEEPETLSALAKAKKALDPGQVAQSAAAKKAGAKKK